MEDLLLNKASMLLLRTVEDTMQVTVNGEDRDLRQDSTVWDLVAEMGLKAGKKGIAVAVNAVVVVRSEWEKTRLAPGDRVDIIHVVQGG